jgi:two-component system response regulator DevR
MATTGGGDERAFGHPDDRIRVIVVEDHALLRRLLAELLTEAGMDVVATAATRREALEATLALRPDAVVLDHWLPDGFGIELCRLLIEELPQLAVIIHSGTLSSFEAHQALDVGAAAVIPKDTRGDDLLAAIRAHAGRRPARSAHA